MKRKEAVLWMEGRFWVCLYHRDDCSDGYVFSQCLLIISDRRFRDFS
jgi:hypothetical protein